MAVDTAKRRLSMLAFGDGNHWHTTFGPDGDVALNDRLHLLDLYSGIQPTGGAVAGPYYVDEIDVFMPGAEAVQAYVPGSEDSQGYTPGIEQSDITPGG